MYNIVEHTLTEVVWADQRCVFQEVHLASLTQLESIVKQIVIYILWSTMFIVPTVDVF